MMRMMKGAQTVRVSTACIQARAARWAEVGLN
jgi:hypothetical protein